MPHPTEVCGSCGVNRRMLWSPLCWECVGIACGSSRPPPKWPYSRRSRSYEGKLILFSELEAIAMLNGVSEKWRTIEESFARKKESEFIFKEQKMLDNPCSPMLDVAWHPVCVWNGYKEFTMTIREKIFKIVFDAGMGGASDREIFDRMNNGTNLATVVVTRAQMANQGVLDLAGRDSEGRKAWKIHERITMSQSLEKLKNACTKDMKRVVDAVAEAGWNIRMTGAGRIMFLPTDGSTHIVSSTKASGRSLLNTVRAIERAGVAINHGKQEKPAVNNGVKLSGGLTKTSNPVQAAREKNSGEPANVGAPSSVSGASSAVRSHLSRMDMRLLEDWLKDNEERIKEHRMSQTLAAEAASNELDKQVSISNVRTAGSTWWPEMGWPFDPKSARRISRKRGSLVSSGDMIILVSEIMKLQAGLGNKPSQELTELFNKLNGAE